MLSKINKFLEKFSEADLKKLSNEEYAALNDEQKEEYKQKLFTHLVCKDAKERFPAWHRTE